MRLQRNTFNHVLLVGLLALLGVTLLYPIALTLRGAFYESTARGEGFTLLNLKLVFEDPALVAGMGNSVKVAATTTLMAVLLALPLAVLSAKFIYPLKGLFNALILVPLILPPFVGAIGFKIMWGREGAVAALTGLEFDLLGSAKFWGVVMVQALSLYPIIYLNASAALANLDPALDEAAENLGASWWRRFFTITLPLIRPGLFAGGTIVFIWSFTELGAPLVFDYSRVTPVQIFNGLKEVESSAQPYSLTLIMLVMAVGIYVLGKLVFGGRAHAMYAKASRAGAETRLTGAGAWAATGTVRAGVRAGAFAAHRRGAHGGGAAGVVVSERAAAGVHAEPFPTGAGFGPGEQFDQQFVAASVAGGGV